MVQHSLIACVTYNTVAVPIFETTLVGTTLVKLWRALLLLLLLLLYTQVQTILDPLLKPGSLHGAKELFFTHNC